MSYYNSLKSNSKYIFSDGEFRFFTFEFSDKRPNRTYRLPVKSMPDVFAKNNMIRMVHRTYCALESEVNQWLATNRKSHLIDVQ